MTSSHITFPGGEGAKGNSAEWKRTNKGLLAESRKYGGTKNAQEKGEFWLWTLLSYMNMDLFSYFLYFLPIFLSICLFPYYFILHSVYKPTYLSCINPS